MPGDHSFYKHQLDRIVQNRATPRYAFYSQIINPFNCANIKLFHKTAGSVENKTQLIFFSDFHQAHVRRDVISYNIIVK